MAGTYPIVGMSPGNSYFKDQEVSYLLKTIVERYGRVGIFVADVPAIATYRAFGYPENRARRDKAIPQGNALKNRVKKAMEEMGYGEDKVRIFDWADEIENNPNYQERYKEVQHLYDTNEAFRNAANATTHTVLTGSKRDFTDIDAAVRIAVHYLLSEIAFLEYAPSLLKVPKVSYVYHKNWPVYEDYIAGVYDGTKRPHMDFILTENPYETFNPIWGLEEDTEDETYADVLERIEKTKTLRVGFIHSIPTFMYDRDFNNFSGIFYEIVVAIARKHGWEIRWTEEAGYGVIAERLNDDSFDLFGSTVWPTPERIEVATFSRSLFKSPVYTYVRGDDTRTEEDLKKDTEARVVIMENDIMDSIAKVDFPDNRRVYVPQLSSNIERAHYVAENKGDFTFVEEYLAEFFNKESEVQLKAAAEKPIRIYDNTFMLKRGETRLKEFLDEELLALEKDGIIKQLVLKYTGSEETFL